MCSVTPALYEFKPRAVARLSIMTPSSRPVNWQWLSFNQSHRTCLIKLLLSWTDTAIICQALWWLKCSSFKSRPKGLLSFLSEFKQNLKWYSLLSLLPIVSSCVHLWILSGTFAGTNYASFCRLTPGSEPKICTLQGHFILSKQVIDVHCYSK